jgi:hypothetical protein
MIKKDIGAAVKANEKAVERKYAGSLRALIFD